MDNSITIGSKDRPREVDKTRLWQLFCSSHPVDKLQQELKFVQDNAQWNDYTFSINSLPEIALTSESLSQLHGVDMFVVQIVAFRSRAHDYGLNYIGQSVPAPETDVVDVVEPTQTEKILFNELGNSIREAAGLKLVDLGVQGDVVPDMGKLSLDERLPSEGNIVPPPSPQPPPLFKKVMHILETMDAKFDGKTDREENLVALVEVLCVTLELNLFIKKHDDIDKVYADQYAVTEVRKGKRGLVLFFSFDKAWMRRKIMHNYAPRNEKYLQYPPKALAIFKNFKLNLNKQEHEKDLQQISEKKWQARLNDVYQGAINGYEPGMFCIIAYAPVDLIANGFKSLSSSH